MLVVLDGSQPRHHALSLETRDKGQAIAQRGNEVRSRSSQLIPAADAADIMQTAPRGGCSKKSGTDPVGFRVEKVVPTNSIRSRRGRSCPQSREAPAPGASHPSAEGRLKLIVATVMLSVVLHPRCEKPSGRHLVPTRAHSCVSFRRSISMER